MIKRNQSHFWRRQINLAGLDYTSLGIQSLNEIELMNKLGIVIYKLTLQDNPPRKNKYSIKPLYITHTTYPRVHLLQLHNNHFIYIKYLAKFIRAFRHTKQPIKHLCQTCLHVFNLESKLKQHTEKCRINSSNNTTYIENLDGCGNKHIKDGHTQMQQDLFNSEGNICHIYSSYLHLIYF